jgi:hypothetical protein
MMNKLDLKKDQKHLYAPSAKEVALVEVPVLNFLMADGSGDPNTAPAFHEAVEALYSLAYTLKFMVKKGEGIDYGVLPLEGLWWAEDMEAFVPETRDKSRWLWTLMIRQPGVVTPGLFEEAREQVQRKKSLPYLGRVRWESYAEGPSAQILHVGPFSEEAATIQKIHAFMRERGYGFNGKHHEIYLSDPRRTAPEKLKTILRQPVKKEV